MRKLLTVLILATGFMASAQEYHRCYTHEAMLQQEEATPGYFDYVNEVFERAKFTMSQDREELYTIPVVVHIVYNTPEQNLADSVVFNQIESLNADFRRLNEDADNLRDTFNTIVGDSFIGFELASVDPDGNPTTGITRTSTEVESFFSFDLSPAEGVKSTADGGIDPWDQDRYLNIWVCDMSFFGGVFLLGYATPPDGLPHWPPGAVDGLGDGVVIQYQAFGSNNPNPLEAGGEVIDVYGRTTTHEVGHYLGLRHIWGDGDCSEEDGVDDTPNAEDQSNQDCDITKNTCTDDIADLGDLPDMVENYMDYSAESCQNSFTLGQIGIMRGVLETARFDLVNENPALNIATNQLDRLDLFPNPSNGIVNIVLPDEINADGSVVLDVVSETGQITQQIQVEAGVKQVQVDGLSAGLYVIRLTSSSAVRTEKLLVY